MGLSEDLIVTRPIHEEFICGICQEVFLNPVSAVGCDHIFCKPCIEVWTRLAVGDPTCPIDFQKITGLEAPPRPFMNLYNSSLQVKCEFHTFGCNVTMNIGDMSNHLKLCDANPDPEFKKVCLNGCGGMIMKKDIESHSCIDFLKTTAEELKLNTENLRNEIDLLKSIDIELKSDKKDLDFKDIIITFLFTIIIFIGFMILFDIATFVKASSAYLLIFLLLLAVCSSLLVSPHRGIKEHGRVLKENLRTVIEHYYRAITQRSYGS